MHRRPKGKYERIRLDQLICDSDLQQRDEEMDNDHALGICKTIKNGRAKGLERVKVRRCSPDTVPERFLKKYPNRTVYNFVTDGFHTVEGYRLASVKEVPCDVLMGTYDDAFYESCGANAEHNAKKRTKADREKAVRRCLEHDREKGVRRSQREVAAVCRVDKGTVQDIIHRLGLHQHEDDKPEAEQKTTGKDGKSYPAARPARKTKERTAAEPEVPVTLTGGWRELPLADSPLELPDYMWPNLEQRKIETCGQLHDALRKGVLLGFMGADGKEAMKVLEDMRTKQEVKGKPPAQGNTIYDWAKVDSYFGVLVRMVDDMARVYPEEHGKPEWNGLHRNLDSFRNVFDQMKARLTKSQTK